MKYIAVIDTDDYKDFKFFEDANGKYLVARDAGAESDEWIALHFTEAESEMRCTDCKFWLLDKDDPNRRCKYCVDMDEWESK